MISTSLAFVVAVAPLAARDAPTSPCPAKSALKNVYFGDLHVHTGYSLDAYAAGDRAEPNDAYRFARGDVVETIPGRKAKIDRPLDFVAVTDHSEFLSVVSECTGPDAPNLPYCNALKNQGSLGQLVVTGLSLFGLGTPQPIEPALCQGPQRAERCLVEERKAWQRIQKAAADNLARCSFTTFVAYEWTAQSGKANLHRNVIFGGDVVPDEPFDFLRYPSALALWKALDQSCTGACDAITIPHNSNASAGTMWDVVDDPVARPYAQRYQRLVEIFQHKGASECLPGDRLSDPACAFEIVPGSFIAPTPGNDDVKQNGPGYVRDALAKGLALDDDPLVMGFIGSTDTHNATPGRVAERNFQGHLGAVDDTAKKRLTTGRFFNPGGITGVWAEENTRESIFAALKRRETYATSGPRIVLRFLALDHEVDDAAADAYCNDPSFPKKLVDDGAVAMGSTLSTKTKATLFAFALKDEADLTRVDLVQLFVDGGGPHARVFSRKVDAASARATCMHFPADAPAHPELYYVRVLEAPTPRWSHEDCIAAPDSCNGQDVTVQERAWSSPIWLTSTNHAR